MNYYKCLQILKNLTCWFFLCNKLLHSNFNVNFHKRKKNPRCTHSAQCQLECWFRSESICCVFSLYSADSALSWYEFPQKHWITISHVALIALFIMQHFVLLFFFLTHCVLENEPLWVYLFFSKNVKSWWVLCYITSMSLLFLVFTETHWVLSSHTVCLGHR